MKLSLDQKEPTRTTSDNQESSALVKENSHLFNCINKLTTDHNVTVSNTMIKVTYKKLKDHPDNEVNNCDETVLNKTMNSDLNSNEKLETAILCNSDISHADKTSVKNLQQFHPSPKQGREFVNGLNLNETQQEGDAISSRVTKSDIKFLKDSLMKSKQSIRSRNKKLRICDKHRQKFRKLKNELKAKKIEEMKRKVEEEAHISKKLKTDIEKEEVEKRDGNGVLMSRSKKKPILLEDPDLPPGWTRFIRTKNKGTANEQYVVYVVNPQGKKFRFKWKLRKFLAKTNSPLDADQFFFGLYKRPKPVMEKEEKESEDAQETSNTSEMQNDASTHSMSEGVVDEKGVLLVDPDLPFGWKRNVHYNNSTGRREVLIISPEGRIFRRRYRLHEYLIKHQYAHNLDRFHFGLYPKKEGNYSYLDSEKDGDYLKSKNQYFTKKYEELKKKYLSLIGNREIGIILKKIDAEAHGSGINHDESYSDHENETGEFTSEKDDPSGPMYDDPNLPEGWKRFIKVRGCGESAGRMEVVIVSPDGRRHRNKKHLEYYLRQKNLNFKPEDFDFSVFGRANIKKRPPQPTPKPETSSSDLMFLNTKKKFTDKPVPALDIESLKEPKITHEGRLINEVNGLMISSGLSSARSERRHKLPRNMQQKRLRSYLDEEGEVSAEGKDIPTWWIERLMKCRSDFRDLELDAAVTVAERTKEFIKKLSVCALGVSEDPDKGLTYEALAKVVDHTESLSPLKTLIPKKITYREFIKLNRPKQFMSFT